jgi:ABC-type amino acid transport substrate-binding protein
MRSFLIPIAALAVALSAAVSFAADTMTTGEVKSVDMDAGTITLVDGTAYSLPEGFTDEGLVAGAEVTISWSLVDNKNVAETVEVTK